MFENKTVTCSGHFRHLLDSSKLPATVNECVEQLQGVDFDTFVFIGYSGAMIAPILAYKLNKELIMVRKNGGNDGSNSAMWAEGNFSASRVVVVDDLISTGRTMSQVMHALRHVRRLGNPELKIVGLLLTVSPYAFEAQPRFHAPPTSKTLFESDCFKRMILSEKDYASPVRDCVEKGTQSPLY